MYQQMSLLALVALFHYQTVAQTIGPFMQVYPTVVIQDTLLNPWAGGMDAPQFSACQLDEDPELELVVFDRASQDFTTFNWEPDSSWKQQNFDIKWPSAESIGLLRDYNRDGWADLYTHSGLGFSLWRHESDHTFTQVSGLLSYQKGGNRLNIPVNPGDIPVIADVNGDGDLDVLTFGVSGERVEYYESTSMETYGVPDSILFKKVDGCFGQFVESGVSDTLQINTCSTLKTANKTLHTGSTLALIDYNDDQIKDLVVGDISSSSIQVLILGPADTTFVATSVIRPMEIHTLPTFPAVFSLKDSTTGMDQVIVSTNSTTSAPNTAHVLAFDRQGNGSGEPWLIQSMIDNGSKATPLLVDVNMDGRTDLLVGGLGKYNGVAYQATLSYYQNTGTPSAPVFTWMTDDFAGLSALNISGMAVTNRDIDDDADPDLVVGLSDGTLVWAENENGAFVLHSNYMDIDVGSFATPTMVDLNKDGRLDLLIGEQKGNLNFFENKGTSTTPHFESTPTEQDYAEIDTDLNCCTGYSSPLVVQKPDDKTQVMTGAENGKLLVFDGQVPAILEQTVPMSNGWVHPSISMDDGWIAIGTAAGGVRLYEFNPLVLTVSERPVYVQTDHRFFDVLGRSGLDKHSTTAVGIYLQQDIPTHKARKTLRSTH